MRVVRSAVSLTIVWLVSSGLSSADLIVLPGTLVLPTDAAYGAITSVLGVPAPSASTILIGVDLQTLGFDPTFLGIVDDGLPPNNFTSGLSVTGIDMDTGGGLDRDGTPVFPSSVLNSIAGRRIIAPAGSIAQTLEPLVNAASYTNKTVAAPGGPGGNGFLLGTPDDVLGPPDAVSPLLFGQLRPEFGFYTLGSLGAIAVGFDRPLSYEANLGGTPYDFVVYDVGGSQDNGFFIFQTPDVAEPSTLLLLAAGGIGILRTRRRT